MFESQQSKVLRRCFTLKKVEASIVVISSVAYVLGFIFFDALQGAFAHLRPNVSGNLRSFFLLMPILFVITWITMTTYVNSVFGHVCAILALLVAAILPVVRMFNVW